jgi:hypothetical protein
LKKKRNCNALSGVKVYLCNVELAIPSADFHRRSAHRPRVTNQAFAAKIAPVFRFLGKAKTISNEL